MRKKKRTLSLALMAGMVLTAALTPAASIKSVYAAGSKDAVVTTVNFNAEYGNKKANIAEMKRIIEKADKKGTDIIVFPEMAVTGNLDVKQAEKKTGKTAAYFSDLAEKYDMYIVYGMPETVSAGSKKVYNSAFVCTPDGEVDSYREMIPDSKSVQAGGSLVTVSTKWGKMALSVGDDLFDMAELSRIYTADGAFMIANAGAYTYDDYSKYDFSATVSNAYSNKYLNRSSVDYYKNSLENVALLSETFIASADMIGDVNGDEYLGGSTLVGITDSSTNAVWSDESNFNKGKDMWYDCIKYYAGSTSSTSETVTAKIDPSFITGNTGGLMHRVIYQPDLYTKWYASLATMDKSAYAPTTKEDPKVAVVDMTPKWADKAANSDKMISYMKQAKSEGVNIIVFPEMALTDYVSSSDPESEGWKMTIEQAETVDGVYATKIANAAKEYGLYVIYGTSEENPSDEKHPYNSAFVATPEGKTETYRKVQPVEGDWCTSGKEPLIVKTPWGGMGISICMDSYAYPELSTYYAQAGCTMLINPTASGGYAGKNFFYNSSLSRTALRQKMVVLSSDLIGLSGSDNKKLWPGKSTIIGNNGVSPIYYSGEKMTGESMHTATPDMSTTGLNLVGYDPKVISKAYAALVAKKDVYDGSSAAYNVGSTSVSKVSKTSGAVKVSLKKVTEATGYEICVSTSKSFAKNATVTATAKKISLTVKKLKAGKEYYVKARAYRTVGGKKVYGSWSKVVKA